MSDEPRISKMLFSNRNSLYRALGLQDENIEPEKKSAGHPQATEEPAAPIETTPASTATGTDMQLQQIEHLQQSIYNLRREWVQSNADYLALIENIQQKYDDAVRESEGNSIAHLNRIKELEQSNTTQLSRIEELEQSNAARLTRIQELELGAMPSERSLASHMAAYNNLSQLRMRDNARFNTTIVNLRRDLDKATHERDWERTWKNGALQERMKALRDLEHARTELEYERKERTRLVQILHDRDMELQAPNPVAPTAMIPGVLDDWIQPSEDEVNDSEMS